MQTKMEEIIMTNLTPVFKEIQNDDFKKGFISAAEWLGSQIIETEQGFIENSRIVMKFSSIYTQDRPG